MLGFISVLLILISVLLIAVVLLQPGKGGAMAGGLGGLTGQFSSVLGTRKAADMLTKLTIGFAITIMAIALITNLWFVRPDVQVAKPITEGVQLPATNQNPLQAPKLPPPTQDKGKGK